MLLRSANCRVYRQLRLLCECCPCCLCLARARAHIERQQLSIVVTANWPEPSIIADMPAVHVRPHWSQWAAVDKTVASWWLCRRARALKSFIIQRRDKFSESSYAHARRMAVAHSAPVNATCPMDGSQKEKNESQRACVVVLGAITIWIIWRHTCAREKKEQTNTPQSPTNENEK